MFVMGHIDDVINVGGHCRSTCELVARLPKTRSGNMLCATMRAIADEQPHEVPATIDDPAALEEIRQVLSRPVSR